MSMSRVASMDAISLDDDWELLLPDHKSTFHMDAECSNGNHGVVAGGGKDQLLLGAELVVIDMDHFGPTPTSFRPPPYDYSILDEEAKKPLLLQLQPSEDAYVGDPTADYYKDIDIVAAEPEREDLMSEVTEILVYEAEEQKETIKSVKESDRDDGELVEASAAAAPDGVSQCAREEEEGVGKTGFGVGSLLRVNGVSALCSFGVAAATFCIMLLGGRQQQQQQLQKRQAHKIQLQHMYPGDEMIQQVVVVQQASMMNQTMSSVMGGASSAVLHAQAYRSAGTTKGFDLPKPGNFTHH